MIISEQIKAARGLISWNQTQLAEAAELSVQTIKRMESKGTGKSSAENVQRIKTALEKAGVVFIANSDPSIDGGPGVRLIGSEAKD